MNKDEIVVERLLLLIETMQRAMESQHKAMQSLTKTPPGMNINEFLTPVLERSSNMLASTNVIITELRRLIND